MEFTQKDVENLKMIRDSDDLELNDELLDSLSKFTVCQGYLNNLEEIYTKQEKSENAMEWAIDDLKVNSNEDLEKLVK